MPRLANILAHKSLMLCYGRGARAVTWRDAFGAARDTPSIDTIRPSYAWMGAICAALIGTVAGLLMSGHL